MAGEVDGPSGRPSRRIEPSANVSFERPGRTRIVVRLFPEGAGLARDLRRAMTIVASDGLSDEAFREALERQLRVWYPKLELRAREDLATIDIGELVWYALRDGRLRAPDSTRDRFYDALATSRELTSETGAALSRATDVVGSATGAVGRRRSGNAPKGHGEA